MVLNRYLHYSDIVMTLITFQDQSVVMKDDKVATELECCCDQEEVCDCPDLGTYPCDALTISVDVSYEDVADTLQASPGRFDSGGGVGASVFLFIDLSSFCGNYGPNGECGWLIQIYICGCDDPSVNPYNCGPIAQTWQAFAPMGNDNQCPEVGNLTFNCVGGMCNANVTGSIA